MIVEEETSPESHFQSESLGEVSKRIFTLVVVALTKCMRLSSRRAAIVGVDRAERQEIRVRFGRDDNSFAGPAFASAFFALLTRRRQVWRS
jgi:hypothetical protein